MERNEKWQRKAIFSAFKILSTFFVVVRSSVLVFSVLLALICITYITALDPFINSILRLLVGKSLLSSRVSRRFSATSGFSKNGHITVAFTTNTQPSKVITQKNGKKRRKKNNPNAIKWINKMKKYER